METAEVHYYNNVWWTRKHRFHMNDPLTFPQKTSLTNRLKRYFHLTNTKRTVLRYSNCKFTHRTAWRDPQASARCCILQLNWLFGKREHVQTIKGSHVPFSILSLQLGSVNIKCSVYLENFPWNQCINSRGKTEVDVSYKYWKCNCVLS